MINLKKKRYPGENEENEENTENSSSLERQGSTIKVVGIILLVLILVGVGVFFFYPRETKTISNLNESKEIDNGISYTLEESNKNIADFKRGEEIIGTIELKSHNSPTEVRNVMPGKDRVVMYYEFSNWKDVYTNGLGEVKFIDMKTGEEIQKDYYFAKAIYEDIIIGDYKKECNEVFTNNSMTENVCVDKLTGSHVENKFVRWERLDTNDIPKEKVTIALITDVGMEDYIDGIWTIAGKQVKEHATWTSSFNDNLISYWTMNETSGNVNDSLGLHNGSSSSSATAVGIINQSRQYAGASSNDWDTIGDINWNTFSTTTINAWVYLIDNTVDGGILAQDGAAYTTRIWFDGNKFVFGMSNTGGYSGSYVVDTVGKPENNVWTMVTGVWNGTQMKIYWNGTKLSSSANFSLTPYDVPTTYIGRYSAADQIINGRIDEVSIWNRSLTDAEISDLWNSGVGLTYSPFFSTAPNVTLNSPPSDYSTRGLNVTFNCSASDNDIIENVSLYINDILNYTESNGATNFTELNATLNFDVGQYNWSCRAYDNATQQVNSSTRVFDINLFSEQLQTYNITSYETKTESYIINISYDSTRFSSVTANLLINGTSYTGTKQGTGNNISFINTHDIPVVPTSANYTLNWAITLTDTSPHTSNSNNSIQHLKKINLTLCDATYQVPYLNFTFKSENDSAFLNASIDTGDFTYWIGTGTSSRTYSFTNSSVNPSYGFCFFPNDTAIYTDLTLKYSSTGYPVRSLVYDNQQLTNSTLEEVLYLLGNANGIYTTFQVVTQAEQPISGVLVTLYRYISSNWVYLSSGSTGDDGGVTFWNNPDYQYNYTFVKSGYSNFSTLLYPTQAAYTIYLGEASSTMNFTNYQRDVIYYLSPTARTLNMNTNYVFWFNITSSYYSLDSFGMTLTNGSGSLIVSNSSTSSTGGNLSLNINTGLNSSLILGYYWYINGNLTNHSSIFYGIFNNTNTNWSINNFFSDLRRYTEPDESGKGIFGMTLFSRTLIIFVIIFVSVGILSYYTGFTGLAPIMTMLFAFVALFDFGLGLIPSPKIGNFNAVTHFPTILAAILAISAWIKEWR